MTLTNSLDNPPQTRGSAWLATFDRVRSVGDHVILTRNVDDWTLPVGAHQPPLRLVEALALHLAESGYTTIRWSLGAGVEPVLPPGSALPPGFGRVPRGRSPEDVLPDLTTLLRSTASRVAVVVDHLEGLAPANPGGGHGLDQRIALEAFHGWGMDAAIRAAGNLVVLVSRQGVVHDLLRGGSCGYRTITVDLPNQAERTQALRLINDLAARSTAFAAADPDQGVDRLASISAGLRIDDVLMASREAGVAGLPLRLEAIVDKKQQAMRELGGDLIEVRDPSVSFGEIAGLAHVVDYVRDCIAADTFPTGMVFAGAPGIGKSLIAEAVAAERGLPLVSLRSIRSPWVGEAERNLESVLWLLENLAPCVVRIDEIDQMLPQRDTGSGGDSGVSARILGRLWEFMGETKRRRMIVWIGTSNRPDLLDAATLDRFQVLVPFLHPGPAEVAELIPVLARQLDITLAPGIDLAPITARFATELTTARALSDMLTMAALWAKADHTPDGWVTEELIAQALADQRPNLDPTLHEFLSLRAVASTSFQSLLPWRARSGLREGYEIPPYLRTLVNADGSVDDAALRRRLDELESSQLRQRLARQ